MDDHITLGEYLTDVIENIDVVLTRITADEDDGKRSTSHEDLTELEAARTAADCALIRVGAISKLIDG